MEETHGSLGRAMLAARNHARSTAALTKPIFTSLKDGMQQMVDALLAYLPGTSLRSATQVMAVEPQAGGWLLSAGYDSDQFDAVIIATDGAGCRQPC